VAAPRGRIAAGQLSSRPRRNRADQILRCAIAAICSAGRRLVLGTGRTLGSCSTDLAMVWVSRSS
jgi:hypothetical protein